MWSTYFAWVVTCADAYKCTCQLHSKSVHSLMDQAPSLLLDTITGWPCDCPSLPASTHDKKQQAIAGKLGVYNSSHRAKLVGSHRAKLGMYSSSQRANPTFLSFCHLFVYKELPFQFIVPTVSYCQLDSKKTSIPQLLDEFI